MSKFKKYMYVIFASMCMLSCSILMACSCSKDVVDINVIHHDVATFVFDKSTYEVGDTANFTVTIIDRYSNSNYKIYANDLLIDSNNGVYSYKLDSGNVTFEIKDYVVNTYTYIFDSDDFEFTTIDDEIIEYGDTFSFYISTDKYSDFDVLVNNNIVTAIDGEYIVNNVTTDLSITVANLVINTYTISYDICSGINLLFDEDMVTTINYGDSLTFDTELIEGYEYSDFKVVVNLSELVYDDGYTIENITQDIDIVITGVDRISNSVSFLNTTGIIVTGLDSVYYGDNYSFRFIVEEGYYLGDNFDILVNGGSIYQNDVFEYVINNVKGNLNISFVGVLEEIITPTTYKVISVPEYLYIDILLDDEPIVIGVTEILSTAVLDVIVYGVAEDYLIDDFELMADNCDIVCTGEFEYTISNISGNISLSVSGVSKEVSYEVNIPTSDLYDIEFGGGKFKEGDIVTFKLIPNDCTLEVRVYGEKLIGIDNTYSFRVENSINTTIEIEVVCN